MNKVTARLIAITGTTGLCLAVIGGWSKLGIMMWIGVGLFSILGLLAIISVITGRRLLPTDDEIFKRRHKAEEIIRKV